MTAYEMMLSESQERMLLVAEKGREQEVLSVFEKWGLEGVIVGAVIQEPRLRVLHHGEIVADIPNQSLTDEAPVYHRPIGTWSRPGQIKVPLDPPPHILEELKKPRDYTADLKKTAGVGQHLLQALGLRAIRQHGADQHRPGSRRRSRCDADQRHGHTRT